MSSSYFRRDLATAGADLEISNSFPSVDGRSLMLTGISPRLKSSPIKNKLEDSAPRRRSFKVTELEPLTELAVYPVRAPRSRIAVTLLNRLLDDVLHRLRLTATNQGHIGPLLPEKTTLLLAKMQERNTLTESSATFDTILANLLDVAYAKTRCLVKYIHAFAGTDDASSADDDTAQRLITTFTEEAVAATKIPRAEKPGRVKTMREKNADILAELVEERRVRKASIFAAKSVLYESRTERLAAERESEVLKLKLENMEMNVQDWESRDAAMAAAAKAEAEAEAARVDAERARLLKEREERLEAGLDEPLSADEAAAEIQRLQLELGAQKTKSGQTIDHLLAVVERKRKEMKALHTELGEKSSEQRREALLFGDKIDALKAALAQERDKCARLTQEFEAARDADAPYSWWHDAKADGAAGITSTAAMLRAERDRRARRLSFFQGPLAAIVLGGSGSASTSDLAELNWATALAFEFIDFKIKCDHAASAGSARHVVVDFVNAVDAFFLQRTHRGCPGEARNEKRRMLSVLEGFDTNEEERANEEEVRRLKRRVRILKRLLMLSGMRQQTDRCQATVVAIFDRCFQGAPLASTIGEAYECQDGSDGVRDWGVSSILISRRHALAAVLLSGLPPPHTAEAAAAAATPTEGKAGGGKSSKGKSKSPAHISGILLELERASSSVDNQTSTASAHSEEVPPIFYDPEAWQCPLLTELCATSKHIVQVQSLIQSVENMATFSHELQTVEEQQGQQKKKGQAAPPCVPDGELCVEMDDFLEVLIGFFESVAEERVVELEALFKSFGKNRHKDTKFDSIVHDDQDQMYGAAKEEPAHESASPKAERHAHSRRHLKHDAPAPNPYGGLSYDGFRALLERIHTPLHGEGDILGRFRFLHLLALPHCGYEDEEPPSSQSPYEYLRDPEAFALNLLRDDIFSTHLEYDPLVLIEGGNKQVGGEDQGP